MFIIMFDIASAIYKVTSNEIVQRFMVPWRDLVGDNGPPQCKYGGCPIMSLFPISRDTLMFCAQPIPSERVNGKVRVVVRTMLLIGDRVVGGRWSVSSD